MAKKLFYVLICSFMLLVVTSCNRAVKVKLYCVKDLEYFNHPLGSVEIEKEVDSTIVEDDLVKLYKDTHGITNQKVAIYSYEIYGDRALTNKLDKDYIVKNNDELYILMKVFLDPLVLGEKYPEPEFFFTGSSIPSEDKKSDLTVTDNLYYPLNSLYVIGGFYIPLETKTVTFDQLFDFYYHYAKVYGFTSKVDFSKKEKFTLMIGNADEDIATLSIGDSHTFGDEQETIVVYYENKWLHYYFIHQLPGL